MQLVSETTCRRAGQRKYVLWVRYWWTTHPSAAESSTTRATPVPRRTAVDDPAGAQLVPMISRPWSATVIPLAYPIVVGMEIGAEVTTSLPGAVVFRVLIATKTGPGAFLESVRAQVNMRVVL